MTRPLRPSFRPRLGLVGLIALGIWSGIEQGQALPLSWPTPNAAWVEGKDPSDYLQPTASGNLISAKFGCVRRNRDGSARFHEGLDLKSIERDRSGESTDPIFAIMPGVVVHVNRVAGHSSYGVYVVIEHGGISPPIHSMYAHLRSVESHIRPGTRVVAGEQIAVMGRTAGGYTIPRQRAHLHLEMGFRVSDAFQQWFDKQDFGSPNRHGRFNGMNMIGFDPLDFFDRYRRGEVRSVLDYLRQEPIAFTLRISSREIPDFIRRYPHLLARPLLTDGPRGWEIGFTWYGLPVRWVPLASEPSESSRVNLIQLDESLLRENPCRRTVVWQGGEPRIGPHVERTLELLFGW